MREPLTKDLVLAAARSLLERDGYRRFSVRRLAAELGVAPTAIYWHVGNRDELLDSVLGQAGDLLGAVSTVGGSPVERIVSTALSVMANFNEYRWLGELAHQRGLLLALLGPARRALATEFAAAGLRGVLVADATNAVIQTVGDRMTFEHYANEWPEQAMNGGFHPGAGSLEDEVALTALARPPDRDRTFDITLRALVAGLLAEHGPRRSGQNAR